jgi:predicted glutamine amidotransferase
MSLFQPSFKQKISVLALLGSVGISFCSIPLATACRLEAIMIPKTQNEAVQKKASMVIKEGLLSSSNSLLAQSKKRPKTHQSHEKNPIYDLEDLSGLVRAIGSPDGWGFVGYGLSDGELTQPWVQKSALPAEHDPNYSKAVEKLQQSRPHLVMAHVRQTDNPKSVAIQNVHPFVFQNWSLMHNGTIHGAFAQSTLDKIASHNNELLGGPKGQTDTERVFYYFLSILLEKYGTTDSSKLSTEQVQAAFRQAMLDLIAVSPAKSKPIKDSLFSLDGSLQTLPSCNVIISDGQHIYAFRRVLNLFLGENDLGHGEKLYVVSSERIEAPSKHWKWLLIPENHFVTLSRNSNGSIQATLGSLN